jgi:ribosome-binding factor A
MKGNRLTRVNDLLLHEIADILMTRLRDPRLGFATVTHVEVSGDLHNARVFVSFLGGDPDFQPRIDILNRAAPFIRHELAERKLDLRLLPELRFKPDHSMEHAQRIQELLRETGLDGGVPAEPPSGGAAPADEDEE